MVGLFFHVLGFLAPFVSTPHTMQLGMPILPVPYNSYRNKTLKTNQLWKIYISDALFVYYTQYLLR